MQEVWFVITRDFQKTCQSSRIMYRVVLRRCALILLNYTNITNLLIHGTNCKGEAHMALTAKKVYAILKRQISDMEAKLNSPVRYRGTVATADLLPLNPDIGDMYNIESKSIYGEAGMNVAWNGVVWDTMGAPIDMSLYIKSNELADWVKQQNKPTYTAEEVGALPADTKIPSKTSELQNDSGFLTKIPDNYLFETDKTLNVSGKAADAKATGDKITELSADISNKLNKNQGSENSGKIAGINESGDIVPMFPVSVDYNEETNCLEFGSDQKMELNKGINLDSTLTKTGYAADAGAVGEITNSLKEDLYVKTYNIFDVNFLPRAFIPLTGSHAGELFLDNNDNYSATNETINVLPNTQYTFSNGSESIPYELQLSVIFYDKDMRFLGYASNTINNSSKFFKFTTIENTNHLRFQLRSTGKGSDIPNIKKWQLNEGNLLPYLDNYVLNCSTDNIGNELTDINIDNPQVRDFVEDVDYTNQEYTITQVGTYSAPSVYYRKDCGFPMVVKWKLNRDIKNQILYISTNKLIPIADTVAVKSYDIPCGISDFAVYNLIPNATYYYKVCGTDFDNNLIVIKEGCFTTIGQVHMLKIDGLKNVRDLGGWLTPNGKIKYGLLFRGCELDDTGVGVELTHEGKKELFDRIRIKTDIDLRTDVGNTKSPIGALVDYNCYPIQPYDTGLKDTITKGLIKSIFEKIEEKLSKSNAIYFHCQGGRDRTGTLAFLILGVLGVSESDIAKDYELTEFAYASYKADNPNTSRKFAQYVSMVSYIKTFNGVTFNDKIISYLLSIGISQATINNIKSYMVA
nr:MAG TPA_asm: tyrosine phosphatase family protein [Caudoviricetes sp.]